MNPGNRPDVKRYHVSPPSWETFDNKTQFISLRSFSSKDDVGFDFGLTLDRYQQNDLGRIIWPHSGTIFYKNLGELADEIQKRNLYLFDFWGYVPGSGPHESGDWTQFRADPNQFKLLEEKLGEYWLGMDNGEQDGRYVGGYAPFYTVDENDRFAQYLNFQRHFERLSEDLGNRLATLVSLNFGHYFLKEGTYTLIGAETAQALPNSQVYYSWIRGAGKQYGVLWFGNASIYNRWGWKTYPDKPTKGASLALLKRLMYSHILYNSAAVGFENGWFVGDDLGPIGKIQQSAKRWLDQNGAPGVQLTTTAFLCDFNCGWSFPRHLYTGKTYMVWGNIPYSSGDYLTNDLFELVYPHYQDSSYFHNEKGFLSATPYGDSVDALLSDAPLEVLKQYSTIFIANEITESAELHDKLKEYVLSGGTLVLTGDAVKKMKDLAGVSVISDSPKSYDQTEISWNDGEKSLESLPFEAYELNLPSSSTVLASCNKGPLAAKVPYGKGKIVVVASPFGISTKRAFEGKVENLEDKELPNPYPLLTFVRKVFEKELTQNVLFKVGDNLAYVVCRKQENVYTIGVFNNELSELPFRIESRIGEVVNIKELTTDESERNAIGFMPEGFENEELGKNSKQTIAGASVRIFEVTVKQENVDVIPPITWPNNPHGHFLALRNTLQLERSIKESVLARSTFFQHWDGVLIDWKYLNIRSIEQVAEESKWLRLQNLRIVVDCSSGVNLFPDLRLVQNDKTEYDRSMDILNSIVQKAGILGAEEIILRTHRNPENNYDPRKTYSDSVNTIQSICDAAARFNIRVSVKVCAQPGTNRGVPGATLETAFNLIEECDKSNLFIAPTLYVLNNCNSNIRDKAKDKVSIILATGWLEDENNGEIWSDSLPLSKLEPRLLGSVKELIPSDKPIIFNAAFKDFNEEYLDQKIWTIDRR